MSSPNRLLWQALRARRRDLTLASILYGSHQLGESMVPVIVGTTISRAVNHGSLTSIGTWLVVLAADFVFLSMSYRFGARASMRAKQYTGHQARMWLTDRVVRPAGGVDEPPGDLFSRASSDANRVGAYAGMFATAVAALIVLIVSTIVLLHYSQLLGAIIVLGTIVLLIAQKTVSRVLKRRSSLEQQQRARATSLAEDLIRGLRVIKGIGAQHHAAAEYRNASQVAIGSSLHAISSQAVLTSVTSLFTGLYLTIIAGVGGWLALRGHLGLGQLVAALGLAQFVIGPMQVVANASAAYARALASTERIREILVAVVAIDNHTTDEHPPTNQQWTAQNIDFVNVGFASADCHVGVNEPCTGLTLTARVDAGTMVGLVCSDPAIAAKIPRLLAREEDPTTGAILLNDTPLPALPLDTVRGQILVSYHDTVLFHGTIRDNLTALTTLSGSTLPTRTGSATTVRLATEAAFADQVIDSTPLGDETPVGDRGEALSGGQRQRVALARALAADPAVLVLHDPTTAVDAATEDGIAARVRQLREHRTTLVLTTSPAWLARCDQVIFLGPRGCRVGRHTSLLDVPDYRDAVVR